MDSLEIIPLITCGPIDIHHEFPLKSSVHENYKPPKYEWPQNVYILPRKCLIDLWVEKLDEIFNNNRLLDRVFLLKFKWTQTPGEGRTGKVAQ